MKPRQSRPSVRSLEIGALSRGNRKRGSPAGENAGPSQRQLRVGEEIRHLLADILLRTEFHDRDLAGVRLTVSEVRMSPDLKHAAIFVSRLGGTDVTPLLPALARVSPYLRSQIAPRIALRITPDLKFIPDAALEAATKINKLLHTPEVARDLDT